MPLNQTKWAIDQKSVYEHPADNFHAGHHVFWVKFLASGSEELCSVGSGPGLSSAFSSYLLRSVYSLLSKEGVD